MQKLILNPSMRFAALKPDDIENNHLIYYLKQLIDEGLVEKKDQEYRLSLKGKHHAARISLKDFTVRLQPKTVSAVICFRDEEVLLYEWWREPGYGQVSLVNGKLHFGETVDEAGRRELMEKTGLEAELTHVGNAYIREFVDGQCIKHQLAHVFTGTDAVGELKSSRIGKPMWVKQSQLGDLDLLPGTLEILESAKQSQRFWFKEFSIG